MNNAPNAASVALFSDNQVLLIQRALPPFAGCWSLPGGRVELGETIEICARREILEELGLQLDALSAVTRLEVTPGFVLQVFVARWNGGTPLPNDEISDWRWASLSEIYGMRTTPKLLNILELAAESLNKS